MNGYYIINYIKNWDVKKEYCREFVTHCHTVKSVIFSNCLFEMKKKILEFIYII